MLDTRNGRIHKANSGAIAAGCGQVCPNWPENGTPKSDQQGHMACFQKAHNHKVFVGRTGARNLPEFGFTSKNNGNVRLTDARANSLLFPNWQQYNSVPLPLTWPECVAIRHHYGRIWKTQSFQWQNNARSNFKCFTRRRRCFSLNCESNSNISRHVTISDIRNCGTEAASAASALWSCIPIRTAFTRPRAAKVG